MITEEGRRAKEQRYEAMIGSIGTLRSNARGIEDLYGQMDNLAYDQTESHQNFARHCGDMIQTTIIPLRVRVEDLFGGEHCSGNRIRDGKYRQIYDECLAFLEAIQKEYAKGTQPMQGTTQPYQPQRATIIESLGELERALDVMRDQREEGLDSSVEEFRRAPAIPEVTPQQNQEYPLELADSTTNTETPRGMFLLNGATAGAAFGYMVGYGVLGKLVHLASSQRYTSNSTSTQNFAGILCAMCGLALGMAAGHYIHEGITDSPDTREKQGR